MTNWFRQAFCVLAAALALTGCAGNAKSGSQPVSGSSVQPGSSSLPPESASQGGVLRLMCLADSEDEAKKAAEGYGITFVSFEQGVAVFETTDDFKTVLARGEGKDLPQISVDNEIHAFSSSAG